MSICTAFVIIWTVSNCEFNANFLTFLGLYYLLFALETIGLSWIIIWWLISEKKSFQFWQEIEFGSLLSYYNCKMFRPFLKRSLLIVTAVFLDFGLKSSLDLLTAKQNIKYEHPTFSQFLARIP